MRAAITETLIATLRQSPELPVEVWDGKVVGLVLRVYGSGRATWFVRAWTPDGRRTRARIGQHPHIGVAEARRLALIQIGIIHQGRDPMVERRAAREARLTSQQGFTVAVALEEWQAARSQAADQPWSPRYIRAVTSALRVHVPLELRQQRLREVERATWTRMLAGVARDKPGAGAFLYTAISAFLSYAEVMGWIAHHPLPRRGRSLIAPHVAPRTRVLEDWEWKAVWEASERESPKLRAFVRLLLLTATRLSETADISAAEISADRAIWIIPGARTKNHHEHLVPLGLLAQRELRMVWPVEEVAGHMLLGRLAGKGFAGQGRLLLRLQQASGTSGWTWHDMRRTARTTMSYLGVAEADAEAALNHVTGRGGLIGVYDRSGPLPSSLAALRTWQAYVAEVLSGHRPVGDAQQMYRAALPEGYRDRTNPTTPLRPKSKPGRPQPYDPNNPPAPDDAKFKEHQTHPARWLSRPSSGVDAAARPASTNTEVLVQTMDAEADNTRRRR
jgi:integrase